MNIISNVLYVSATTSLLVGSILTFQIDEIITRLFLFSRNYFIFYKGMFKSNIRNKNRKRISAYEL